LLQYRFGRNPRSITQIRSAFPYCVSILLRNLTTSYYQRYYRPGSHKPTESLRVTIRAMTTCTQSNRLSGCNHASVCRRPGTGIALKIRARQIIEEHIELRIEKIFPPLRQMIKQRPFMHHQSVQAVVEFVDLRQFKTHSKRSPIALLSYQYRWSFHSLPGSIS